MSVSVSNEILAANVYKESSRSEKPQNDDNNGMTSFFDILKDKQAVKAEMNINVITLSTKRCEYFDQADESGFVTFNGIAFQCDYQNNKMLLGDCTDDRNCIRVYLSGGGSLVFNRNNIGDILTALSQFNKEDQRRILLAIEKDKIAQDKLRQMEKERLDMLFEMTKAKGSDEEKYNH